MIWIRLVWFGWDSWDGLGWGRVGLFGWILVLFGTDSVWLGGVWFGWNGVGLGRGWVGFGWDGFGWDGFAWDGWDGWGECERSRRAL